MPRTDAYDLDYRPATYWDTDEPRTAADFDEGDEPPRYPDEVEIVGIQIASTLGDWVALTARRGGGLIKYRITSEVEETGGYSDSEPLQVPGITESREPLTFGELIHSLQTTTYPDSHMYRQYAGLGLIETCRTGIGFPFPEYREEREANRGFVKVNSTFYPQLAAYYEAAEQEWIDEVPTRPAVG